MKRFIAILLALFMVLTIIPVNNAKAEEVQNETNEWIVLLELEKVLGNDVVNSLSKDELDVRGSIELDKAISKIEKLVGKLDIKDRIDSILYCFLVDLTDEQVEKIRMLDYISLSPNIIYEKPKYVPFNDQLRMTKSLNIIGLDQIFHNKYDGEGTAVAIIDSQMNPRHEVFYLDPGKKELIKKEDVQRFFDNIKIESLKPLILPDELYVSNKIPFAYNYVEKSENLYNPKKESHIEAHGQHVAGTATGNKVKIDGKRDWVGVAPNAQALLMTVFGDTGGTSSFIYLKSIVDATKLGACAINMSLGSTKGTIKDYGQSENLVVEAINNAYKMGTNVVISAGNDGEFDGKIPSNDPDYGIIGAPGINTNAITVASIENTEYYAEALHIGDNAILFGRQKSGNFEAGQYDLVDCGQGLINEEENVNDFEGLNLTGKVALIERGGDTFTNKVIRAQERGAIGAIIYNNNGGLFGMSLEDTIKIPVISVSREDGLIILKNIDKKLIITGESQYIKNPNAGYISDFSSWGLTSDGELKPDLTAPGGQIESTATTSGKFFRISGTSMAAPHVTGAVAVLRQAMNENPIYKDIPKSEIAPLVKTLLMNSAFPNVNPRTDTFTSPRSQGAGVINVKDAANLDFTVVNSRTNIASCNVGDIDNEITLNLKFRNYSDVEKVLKGNITVTIENTDEDNYFTLEPLELFQEELDENIVIPAKGTIEKTITVPLKNTEQLKKFTKGAFVEGFIFFTDQSDKNVSVPFVAFKGDYKNLDVLEKPIYDMDFENGEVPFYWPKEFSRVDWQKFSTHVSTNLGGKEVILGLKNFDEINNYKNEMIKDGLVEPKPEFEKLVISPKNADGKHDEFNVYGILYRSAKYKGEVIDSKGVTKARESYEKLVYKSIGPYADSDKNKFKNVQYTLFGNYNISLKDLDDGDYKFLIKLTPIIENATQQQYEINFTIDNTYPEIKNGKVGKEDNKLTFEATDNTGLRTVIAEYNGKEVTLNKNSEGKYELDLPKDVDAELILLKAIDLGYNTTELSVAGLLEPNAFGNLKVNIKTSDFGDANVKYSVYYVGGENDGKKALSNTKLKLGDYKLVVEEYSDDYILKSDKEIPFTLSEENRDKTIDIRLEKIEKVAISIIIRDKKGLTDDDFKIIAIDKNDRTKEYEFIPGRFFYDARLPYGEYELQVRFKDGIEYNAVFNQPSIVVDKNTEAYTIYYLSFVKGNYGISIETIGTKEKIDYEIYSYTTSTPVDRNSLTNGEFEVYPKNIPNGYYVIPAYHIVELTEDAPSRNVSFEFKPINEKIHLNIIDDYDGAEYVVKNLQAEYDLDESSKFSADYVDNMELNPGHYYVIPKKDLHRYGRAKVTKKLYTEFTLEEGTKTLEFEWIPFVENPNEFGNVFLFVDKPLDLTQTVFEIKFTSSFNKVINHTYDLLKMSTTSLNIPYGVYDIEVTNLPYGYEIANKKIWINTPEPNLTIRVQKVKVEEKDVTINFKHEGKEVTPVKYTVNGKTYSTNNIKLPKGTYDLVVVAAPNGYVQKNKFDTIEVTDNSNVFDIELVKNTGPVAGKGSITVEIVDPEGNPIDIGFNINKKLVFKQGTVNDLDFGEYEIELPFSTSFRYKLIKPGMKVKVNLTETAPNQTVRFVLYKDLPPEADQGSITVNMKDNEGNKVKVFYYIDGKFQSGSKKIAVNYGKHIVSLSLLWNNDNIYEKVEPGDRVEVTVDENNKDVQVDFIFYKKGAPAQEVNKEKLDEEIKEEANVKQTEKYVYADKENKKAYDEAIAKGKEVLANENATQEEVDSALEEIISAKEALNGKAPVVEVNKEKLEIEIKEEANVKQTDKYVYADKENKKAYDEAIAKGKEVLANENATQEEVDSALEEIISAKEALNGKAPVVEVNKEKLDKEIKEEANVKQTDKYVYADKENKKAYDEAIAKGKEVLVNENATQEEVDSALEEIISAKEALNGKAPAPTPAPTPVPTPDPTPVPTPIQPIVPSYPTYPTYPDKPIVDKDNKEDKKEDNKDVVKEETKDELKEDTKEEKAEDIIIPEVNTVVINFSDVENSEYLPFIEKAASRGLLNGTGENKFEPEKEVSRAESLAILYRIVKDKEVIGEGFSDVEGDDWFKEISKWAKFKGIIIGDDKGNFNGDKVLTKAEIAMIIARFINIYEIEINNDINLTVDSEHWAKNEAVKLMQNGILDFENVIDKNAFEKELNEPITRGELAKILEKLIEVVEK